MRSLALAGFVTGGFIVVVLVVLGLRGRFGTTEQRGDYELYELEHSSDVPKGARTTRATCRGHDGERHQIIGAGVLWATGDFVGFALRSPRRHLRIPRARVESAIATDAHTRPGGVERADGDRLLVVTWEDPHDGQITVVFDLDDAPQWAAALSGES